MDGLYFGTPAWKTYYRDLYKDDSAGWLDGKRAVAELAKYCRDNNIPLLFVHQPELHELTDYPFSDVTRTLQEVATQNDLRFLDLLPTEKNLEPQSLWVTPTDAHPNPIATTAFADAIAKELLARYPQLWGR